MQQDDADERLEARLFELENQDLADRRAELTGERFLSLIHDPVSSRVYIFQHGTDATEGSDIPTDTEVWQYGSFEEAERAYAALLGEAAAAGELVDPESDEEELGDFETDGLNSSELYADTDDVDDEDEEANVSEPEDIDALDEVVDIGGVDETEDRSDR